MSTKVPMSIDVSPESYQAFIDRGRSTAFDCLPGTEKGTQATIKTMIDGKYKSSKRFLHRACGKKNGNRFTLMPQK